MSSKKTFILMKNKSFGYIPANMHKKNWTGLTHPVQPNESYH